MLTSLGMGGAEKQVIALAERMKARGHAVWLIVLLGRQAEEWPTSLDRSHLNLRYNPFSMFAGFGKLRASLRGFQPDLIHSHTFPANMAARLYRLFSRRAPAVSTIHNVYEGGWGRMTAYRLSDGLSCATTAVSESARVRYVRIKAVPAGKIQVLTNGIDSAEFTPNPGRRVRLREQMGLGDAFIWLAAGRLAPAKDYPNLLRAYARVRAEFPSTRLMVAGELLGSESASIQNYARKLGLEDCIDWLGLCRDMPALLDASDGFVLASAWEGMPLVVGEAMAMEKPVVATDVGGVGELVGDCGLVAPAKNSESLADAMLATMRTTPETSALIGGRARKRIQEQFSIDQRAEEWEVLYATLLGQNMILEATV